jgi:hypothetical protein
MSLLADPVCHIFGHTMEQSAAECSRSCARGLASGILRERPHWGRDGAVVLQNCHTTPPTRAEADKWHVDC